MIKNKIKVISIGILIACTLINTCHALDKDDIFKYFLSSSYPEVKIIDNDSKVDNNKEEKKETKERNTEEKNDNQYVNFYIGEENKPVAKNKEKETSKVLDASYNNSLRITKSKPEILIYHTHSMETYADSSEGNYHSKNIDYSVMSVGKSLTTELTNRGWGVAHSMKYNDLSYTDAYLNSGRLLNSMLNKYNSIKISIDIHRDGQNVNTYQNKKLVHDKYTANINGQRVAKFFLVVGRRNGNITKLKKQAEEITKLANKKYPGIACEVVVKQYGRFNQYMADNGMLIEIGNNATSTKEAKGTCKYLAEILDEYFASQK